MKAQHSLLILLPLLIVLLLPVFLVRKKDTPSPCPVFTSASNGNGIILEDPIVIPLGNAQMVGASTTTKLQQAYRHIFSNINRHTTDILLYPFAFNHTHPDTKAKTLIDGAALHHNPPEKQYGWAFNYMKSEDIELHKAKALYDGNIAVLRAEALLNGRMRDLTYESDYYCQALHVYLGRYAECFDVAQYKTYMNTPTHEENSFVYVGPNDISDDFLMGIASPRFSLLVLPDIMLNTHGEILSQLGATGLAALRRFVLQGGVIYASGKATRLVEAAGLLNTGTVDTAHLVSAKNNKFSIAGCAPASERGPIEGQDFDRQLLCTGLLRGSDPYPEGYLLSGHPVDPTRDPGLRALLEMSTNASTLFLKDASTGVAVPIAGTAPDIPFVLTKAHGKGRVLLNVAHPVANADRYYPLFFHSFFAALAQDTLVNRRAEHSIASENVAASVFPALETDIVFDMTYDLWNLYTRTAANATLSLTIPPGFSSVSRPAGCTFRNSSAGEEFLCAPGTLGPVSVTHLAWQVRIDSATATQKGTEIPVSHAVFNYTLVETGRHLSFDLGPLHISAAMAALIRTDYNTDPICFYPMFGEGYTVDSVVHAENKEDSTAYEVEHIAIVPLVSPLFDGNEGDRFISILEFNDAYYKKETNGVADYIFPFTKGEYDQLDYIDFKLLSKRATHLDVEWDESIKATPLPRDNSTFLGGFPNVTEFSTNVNDVTNAQWTCDIPSIEMVLRQREFNLADSYFEHGQMRYLVYADTTRPEGAYHIFNASGRAMPAGTQNLNRLPEYVQKRQIGITRCDVHFDAFWPYPLPAGVNRETVITVDRYTHANMPACRNITRQVHDPENLSVRKGQWAEITEPGYYNSSLPRGIKPREFSNSLLTRCQHAANRLHYDDVEEKTGGNITRTHYLIEFTHPGIEQASDVMFFDAETGKYQDYPEIGFVRAHANDVVIAPDVTHKGGVVVIRLPPGAYFANHSDPVAKDWIVWSADQVAFTGTTYNATTREIRSYFRRGNMPNEKNGKDSVMFFAVENLLGVPDNITCALEIHELEFDFTTGAQARGYLRYVPQQTRTLTLTKRPFMSLPAIKMVFKLGRPMQAYEFLEPFLRYKIYYQELHHRYIYGIVESHHVTNPGLVSSSSGFSIVGAIGINPVPFREYLTTGKSQFRPLAATTSRIEWNDVWGRHWAQPLRCAFIDVPPIPPPVRNFMMTTTFEMLDPASGARLLEWPSDRAIDVHVTMKLLNNYPKFFDITTCPENRKRALVTKSHNVRYGQHVYQYDPTDPMFQIPADAGDDTYLWDVTLSKYGACFEGEGTCLKGANLTDLQRQIIHNLSLCDYELSIEDCPDVTGLPTVSKRPHGNTAPIWNYSPRVESFFPTNYVQPNMWDMTHYDYSDTPFDKSYPFHMDNLLPNIDTSINRPHNIIAAPIWKGLGYKVTYAPTLTNPSLPGKKGWWSDNLQNKDCTILSGRGTCNDVSVDKPDVPDASWIRITDLKEAETRPASRMKNMYVCDYNRDRFRYDVTQTHFAYHKNIVKNNVVPIVPDLEKNDLRLTNYVCNASQAPLAPQDIHSVDNRVYTSDARDWLYFAANLRGGARETVHMMLHIEPFGDVRVEGRQKIYDGGRFVYWNPCCGPNTFLVVDNPVNVVQAKRSDIALATALLPAHTTTFHAMFYQTIEITDPDEDYREWTQSPYVNHYGFGDATAYVYVGEEGTRSILNPGEKTIAKVELLNNAGFDWALVKGAMEGPELDPLQATLASGTKLSTLWPRNTGKSIRKVTQYNFMSVAVPSELAPYVTIKPSTHCENMVPIFFDFSNINAITVRDGYKATYFYEITLTSSIPDSLRGRPYELNITLHAQYFSALPGAASDPTAAGTHNYTLRVPAMTIGIPYASSHADERLAGKVFYTSGYSRDLRLSHRVPNSMQLKGAALATPEDLVEMSRLSSLPERREVLLREFFANLTALRGSVNVTQTPDGVAYQRTSFDISAVAPTLPIRRAAPPDDARLSLVVQYYAPVLPFGRQLASTGLRVEYTDWIGNARATAANPVSYSMTAKGAFLEMSSSQAMVGGETLLPLFNQDLPPDAPSVVKMSITATNVGDDIAYNAQVELQLGDDVEPMLAVLGVAFSFNTTSRRLVLSLFEDVPPGDLATAVLYLTHTPNATKPAQNGAALVNAATVLFVDSVRAHFDLTSTAGSVHVTQDLENSHIELPYRTAPPPPTYTATLVAHEASDGPIMPLERNTRRMQFTATTNVTASSADLVEYGLFRALVFANGTLGKMTEVLRGASSFSAFNDTLPAPAVEAHYKLVVFQKEDETKPALEVTSTASTLAHRIDAVPPPAVWIEGTPLSTPAGPGELNPRTVTVHAWTNLTAVRSEAMKRFTFERRLFKEDGTPRTGWEVLCDVDGTHTRFNDTISDTHAMYARYRVHLGQKPDLATAAIPMAESEPWLYVIYPAMPLPTPPTPANLGVPLGAGAGVIALIAVVTIAASCIVIRMRRTRNNKVYPASRAEEGEMTSIVPVDPPKTPIASESAPHEPSRKSPIADVQPIECATREVTPDEARGRPLPISPEPVIYPLSPHNMIDDTLQEAPAPPAKEEPAPEPESKPETEVEPEPAAEPEPEAEPVAEPEPEPVETAAPLIPTQPTLAQSAEPPHTPVNYKHVKSRYRAVKGDTTDERVAQIWNRLASDEHPPLRRLEPGFYQFGTRRIYARVLPSDDLVVRVGGGFQNFAEYVERHRAGEVRRCLEQGISLHSAAAVAVSVARFKRLAGRSTSPPQMSPKGNFS